MYILVMWMIRDPRGLPYMFFFLENVKIKQIFVTLVFLHLLGLRLAPNEKIEDFAGIYHRFSLLYSIFVIRYIKDHLVKQYSLQFHSNALFGLVLVKD